MPPPLLPDDLLKHRIVEAVRAGASRTAAAEAARVSRSSLHLWLKRGASGEEPYLSFAAKVRAAEGELELELLEVIKKHSVNSWQAAAWILERKFQKRWAIRKDRQDRKGPPLTEEEILRLIKEGAEALGFTLNKETKP
jgi:hypothetical protein